ncbi:MAG: CusA/CzcA family heavy metal efflux RND transporter [Cyanobacteriota bacterium]
MIKLFENIINISIKQRFLVMILVILISILGIYNYKKLPIDAVPDITNVQVQINTLAQGYSPLESEQRITYVIETAMSGLPSLDYTRSVSKYGLSQITVVFKDGTDIYFGRKLISEKLQEIKEKLPPNIEPIMGPISTGLGEIFSYTIEAKNNVLKEDGTEYTPLDLKLIQDWIIKPQLKTIKGVADINSTGGYTKNYQISPISEKLIEYKISLDDVFEAVEKNNSNLGAGYIEKNGMQYVIRIPSQISSIDEINKILVKNENGSKIFIKDIAKVFIGNELRTGAATKDGKETVMGTVFMLVGENSKNVSEAVSKKLEKISQSLPKGIITKTVYDRTILVDKTIDTVKKNLFEGAILVIVVLFFLLGNIKAALITAMVIPLSMLFTITGMLTNKISANLLSLGAIDFGIIVDGSVIIIENCIRCLAEKQKELGRVLSKQERFEVIKSASSEVRKATMFGELIIMIVYLPILTLSGIEGKMFQPMAMTVIIALIGAMIFSITFIPSALAIFLNGKISEKENIFLEVARKLYEKTLKISLKNKSFVIISSLTIIVLSALISTKMGSEFIPSLDEGDIAVHALRIPGTSLSQAIKMQTHLESKIKEFNEVETIFSKLGTAEIANDPMPPNVADTFVIFKPRKEWENPNLPKSELIKKIQEVVEKVPGNKYEFTQPIQMRFNELISGVRSDIAVKVYGDDMDKLLETATKISSVLEKVQGAEDVKVEQVTGLPMINIHIKRDEIFKYGLTVSEVQNTIGAILGGKKLGDIFEGDRRFDIIVRLDDKIRENLDNIKNFPILLPEDNSGNRKYVPIKNFIEIENIIGANQIGRENGKRVVIATANVRNRDLGSFIKEADEKISSEVIIPVGYWTEWGGQFENLISASNRLKIVVPITLLLIFLLLYSSFNSIKDSLIIFTGVPLALCGGIFALWIRNIPFSISAGVGFIALSGIAVLNGLVMISFIKKLIEDGKNYDQAIFEGAITRLRPVLMTALVASLGFIPMAISTGIGSEVQKPLATVVIGGIISSTLLTLIVLPVLYSIFSKNNSV